MREGMQAIVALTGPCTVCKIVAVNIEWCTSSKLHLLLKGSTFQDKLAINDKKDTQHNKQMHLLHRRGMCK
mgnify:CR=1 FL=1